MIPGKSLDNFSEFLSLGLFNNLISFQDTPILIPNPFLLSNIIIKKQKEFIISNNQVFYEKYKDLYMQNVELKNKLEELITEKKRLKNNIINLDKKLIKEDLDDKKQNNKISNFKKNIIEPYRKRIRRKRIEINTRYECTFTGCNKRYLSKCALNMHIKIKHQLNGQKNSDLYN